MNSPDPDRQAAEALSADWDRLLGDRNSGGDAAETIRLLLSHDDARDASFTAGPTLRRQLERAPRNDRRSSFVPMPERIARPHRLAGWRPLSLAAALAVVVAIALAPFEDHWSGDHGVPTWASVSAEAGVSSTAACHDCGVVPASPTNVLIERSSSVGAVPGSCAAPSWFRPLDDSASSLCTVTRVPTPDGTRIGTADQDS